MTLNWDREPDQLAAERHAEADSDRLADKTTEQAADRITAILRDLPADIWPDMLSAAALNALEERYSISNPTRTVSVTIDVLES